MSKRAFFFSSLALAGCSPEEQAEPLPETVSPPFLAANALPAILRAKAEAGMEALISGRLVRRGPCLYLDTGNNSLILWGDTISIARSDEAGWLLTDETTGEQFREGDWLQGGGGHYPDRSPVSDFTEDAVPFDCTRTQAMQFHSVKRIDPPKPARNVLGEMPPPPPPPPPGPPPSVSRLDDPVEREVSTGSRFPRVTISGVADPQEALFVHLIQKFQKSAGQNGKATCLTDTPPKLLARLSVRFDGLLPQDVCDWKNGGVIRRDTGESALFVHAKVDCSGSTCTAEGGGTYGNLGAEGWGYRLRRTKGSWELQQDGRMWIS